MTGPRRPMGHSMQEFEAQGPFYFDTAGPRFRGLWALLCMRPTCSLKQMTFLIFFQTLLIYLLQLSHIINKISKLKIIYSEILIFQYANCINVLISKYPHHTTADPITSSGVLTAHQVYQDQSLTLELVEHIHRLVCGKLHPSFST